ncbi:MAG TPA: efflux RND transporter periplasmic adaptor subunit [Acidiferrobacter sp.]|nr:efflux RND transporter periplasmic adaptor subunit [Acidiferrobacter sp.]
MKRRIVAIAAGVLALGAIWVIADPGHLSRLKSAPPPTASVTVATLVQTSVVNHLVAYGRVVAAPWAVHVLTEPFAVSVARILVNAGQSIGKGSVLAVLTPGPTARLALLQAQNSDRLAQLALTEERTRVHLGLATRAGLLRAQKAFDVAALQVRVFHSEGLRSQMTIKAPVGGVVRRIFVQGGATINAGQPLMDIVAGDHFEARLGVEPEDVPTIHAGERVRLSSFEGAGQTYSHGLVAVISRVMDPATHMINVFVTLPAVSPYLLGEYIEGRFTITSRLGLTVARSAVVPVGHHYVLYTVAHGHAVKNRVRLGAHNRRLVQVIGPHLHRGMAVVVLGNYELKPGMAVRVNR